MDYLQPWKPPKTSFIKFSGTLECRTKIVSDRGPQFISRVWKAFFRLLGVTVSLSSGYHPQTNGQAERKIQELGRYLRTYCQEDQFSWRCFLPWAEYAQNSLCQNTGYQPPLFPWMGEPSEVPAVAYWFWASERVWDSAHIHLQRAVRRHKTFEDARRAPTSLYQPGDRVWLSTHDLWLRLPCRKLSTRYIGPFKITRQITYHLQLPPRYRIHPTFHVSLLKPWFSPPPDQHEPDEHPPPEIQDEPSVYQVRNILDSRWWESRLEYFMDWEGYGPKEQSWVARDDILDPMLLKDFHRTHPDRPAPRGRGNPIATWGCQEPPLGEGVVSESHSHNHRRQPQSPDPSHLSFVHLQLLSLINTPMISTCSLTIIVRSTVHYTEQYLTPFALTCVYLPFRLSSDPPVFTPGLRVLQRFSIVDFRSPQCPDSIPLWTISISVLAQIHRRYLFTRYLPARHSPLFLQFPQ